MRLHRVVVALLVSVFLALVAAACGGSGGGSGGGAKTATPEPVATRDGTLTAAPTPDPTQQRNALLVQSMRRLVLQTTDLDVPSAYTQRNNQPVIATDVVTAQIGIPPLAKYLQSSDLYGAWAAFYSRTEPPSAISSIAYLFGTDAGAAGMITAISALTAADYPAATSVERVQADQVGEASQMMRYALPGAKILEYTWLQGRLTGQVVLRYEGDLETPDDVARLVALARKQWERMRTFEGR